MSLQEDTRMWKREGTTVLTIRIELLNDSQFPFKETDELTMKIEGKKLITQIKEEEQ